MPGWTQEEIEMISADEKYLAEIDPKNKDYHHETLQEKHERLAFEAKLVAQDPELCEHYRLEK